MPDGSDAVVRLDRVTKRFGGVAAVDDLSLDIPSGEFFSMLGPSGCGKTTTLRMIAGFEHPDEGEILLDGAPVSNVPPYRRNVNTVFQSYALFEHMSIWDNVAFGLERRKVAKPEIRRRVGEMLELVQLGHRAKAQPRQLSGGQQQRVALARARVNLPAVLLLDEPLGALDLKLRRQMQIELKQIQREVGITFVYVTHDQEEALTMSDRIAVMDGGVVQQCGIAADVYEHPANLFVAQFIGVSNVFPGTAGGAGVRLEDGSEIDVPVPAGVRSGDPVHVLVRPEKLALGTDGSDGAIRLQGVLAEVVYLGSITHYHVDVAGARVVVVEKNTGDRTGVDAPLGVPMTIHFRPEHALVFSDAPGDAHSVADPVEASL
jgi:spermidine/putrescine transport system ATP-binding protein